MTAKGKTIKLFYEQGIHQGIIHAEMINWTGFVLVAPRTALSTLYQYENDTLHVTEDFDASSPSTAACYLTSYPISGPRHWKVKGTNITYNEWEKQQLQ